MYIFGASNSSVLHGSENIIALPSIHERSFKEKDFQIQFEKWWNSHFYLRKKMLKLKNQFYDLANFGKIHSGYNNQVIEGKYNYLFEKGYFSSFDKHCKILPKNFAKIKRLNDSLKEKNIELYFVLAPNKAVTYFDYIPQRYKYYLGKDCLYYRIIEQELNNLGINVLNAQPLVSKIRVNDRYQPFSITGTHWNHYGAGRTVQYLAKRFNWGDVEINDVEESKSPYTTEKDIANVLNLLKKYKPKQRFYRPIYKLNKTLLENVTIIGNSFSKEFKIELVNTGLFSSINHYKNEPLSIEDMEKIKNSKKIIFVYTDIAIMNEKDQLYKKINFILEKLN
ncbi:MAG: hypothetical protein MJ250_06890 [Alphaproteobacteria bacterium]|nr:hypothetical protein [Alphaproteobacteria bacterium]